MINGLNQFRLLTVMLRGRRWIRVENYVATICLPSASKYLGSTNTEAHRSMRIRPGIKAGLTLAIINIEPNFESKRFASAYGATTSSRVAPWRKDASRMAWFVESGA